MMQDQIHPALWELYLELICDSGDFDAGGDLSAVASSNQSSINF